MIAICSELCSMKFCCRRCGVVISSIMLLKWSELHILCMISFTYHILSVMLRLKMARTRSDWSTQLTLYAINDLVTSLGFILPPMAYSLISNLKPIYEAKGFKSEHYSSVSTKMFTNTTMFVAVYVSSLYIFFDAQRSQ